MEHWLSNRSSNASIVRDLKGPPGMAFPRPEMYPGHQQGVPANWNYQQFPAQMPPGFMLHFVVSFFSVTPPSIGVDVRSKLISVLHIQCDADVVV